MRFFAIGDLHLAGSVDKPMDVFGETWLDHASRIRSNWLDLVTPDDVVLLPGDISWAMTLDEASVDLEWIGVLPGTKVMIRGNHDYWWSGITKIRNTLVRGHYAVQNDSLVLGEHVICGTRGWLLPSHPNFTDEDANIYRREAERLHLSLKHATKSGLPIIAMMHYPPSTQSGEDTLYTDLLRDFGVSTCVYGHLHGHAHRFAFEGEKDGVTYQLVSADYVSFTPVPVL